MYKFKKEYLCSFSSKNCISVVLYVEGAIVTTLCLAKRCFCLICIIFYTRIRVLDGLSWLGCWRIIGGRCSRRRPRRWLRLVQILARMVARILIGSGGGSGLTGLAIGAAVQWGIAANVHQIRLARHVMRPEDGGRRGAFRWPGVHGLSLAHFLSLGFSLFGFLTRLHGGYRSESGKKGSQPSESHFSLFSERVDKLWSGLARLPH